MIGLLIGGLLRVPAPAAAAPETFGWLGPEAGDQDDLAAGEIERHT